MRSASQWVQFCYRCSEWFTSPDDWGKHCEWHLDNLSMRCEIYTWRYTLLVPGICPFCVGCCEIAPEERFHQWTSSASLWRHVNGHLEGVSWPMHCPHPQCKLEIGDRELFGHHLVDMHGKTFLAKETSKRKREEKDEGTEDLEAMPGLHRKQKSLKVQMKTRPGENAFRNDNSATNLDDAFAVAIRSMTVKSKVSAISPKIPPSLAMTARPSIVCQ